MRLLFAALVWAALLSHGASFAQGPNAALAHSGPVDEARELLDTYYGDQRILDRAANLLEQANRSNPRDANNFVESARIAAMRSALSGGRPDPELFARFGALLDQALSIDDSNVKAHLLKAEFFEYENRPDEMLRELDRAKALGTDDPWLLVGYGKHSDAIKAYTNAHRYFSQVEKRGPGRTNSDRKAYVVALYELSKLIVAGESLDTKLPKYAELILRERHPTDAWNVQALAARFLGQRMFDQSVRYAREAVKTMDFGAGRLTLAAALYAHAANEVIAGRFLKEVRAQLDEAAALGFSREQILAYLHQRSKLRDIEEMVGRMTL